MRTLRLALVLAGLALFLWGSLWVYGSFLSYRLEKQLAELRVIEDDLPFYRQLSSLKILLKNNLDTSRILEFLEEQSVKAVVYDTLEVFAAERQLTLEGFVDSRETLAKLIQSFNESGLVEKLEASELGLVGRKTKFKIILELKENIFEI